VKQTRLLMGMPITVEIAEDSATKDALEAVFSYFDYVDWKFSTYKEDSEISLINRHALRPDQFSEDMRTIFALAEETRQETNGYFDIARKGLCDPSGIVKGWAIDNAAKMLGRMGFRDYYVEAGGDIQAIGRNSRGQKWRVGIRNPFNLNEVVKVLAVSNCGVATSGTYVRGQHIYNPKHDGDLVMDIVSLTVIGPDIYEADRFATAAFAMGREGILFVESREALEGYMIDREGQATFTSGFAEYVDHA
jgi:thiamine biosynthesis lipoprotein